MGEGVARLLRCRILVRRRANAMTADDEATRRVTSRKERAPHACLDCGVMAGPWALVASGF
jgi:hypothetical protein